MKRESFERWPCSVARTVGLVGDGWTLLILRELFYGETRFDGLVTTLGIARSTLTDRLRTLTDSGIVSREIYQSDPVRHEYLLTEKGSDLFGVVAALNSWGDRWMSGDEGAPMILHHDSCGHDLDAAVVCRECGTQVRHRDISVRVGPGFPQRLKKLPAFAGRFGEPEK
ncbi:putative HxlR family transcriptional regulator [Gordonia effusa NBRC 100432]|uniref:Putative HxlR family transcriptional regulator n=1 Tax=Gordonia effusa NBRC 100432 TaxID=1077974 RepID=H0R3K1_9ACTN|nr:helix-turn-helix domain-containing protein [Gordonia effusa]GAB19652.1 putative HxlR family transcriptional regulator [Gordonia effusa NBRC 100432]